MMRWLSVTACVALGSGCATAPPVPAQRFTDAETNIKAAQDLGAENSSQGKVHLQQARDQLDAAKRLNKDEPAVAARKIDNAQAEAELAKSLTREQATRAEADQVKAQLSALQSGTGGAR
jgi:Domain of unknown function (DUF4398)